MTITYHRDLLQGSDEWLAARCGLLTASEMDRIISPVRLAPARNDKASAHLYELLAQRITRYVEPSYVSDDMLRGMSDEIEARALYARHYAPVQEVGFVTNDEWGFTVGCSPDGLVGDDGMIECKSRRQKFQIETLIADDMPAEYVIQVQTSLMVTGRAWCDFVSYCGGLPLAVLRVPADPEVQDAILEAATDFELRLSKLEDEYRDRLATMRKLIPTERRIEQEMTL